MNLRCSNCKTKKPKTKDGTFIVIHTDEWDSSFWLFCSEDCQEKKLGVAGGTK